MGLSQGIILEFIPPPLLLASHALLAQFLSDMGHKGNKGLHTGIGDDWTVGYAEQFVKLNIAFALELFATHIKRVQRLAYFLTVFREVRAISAMVLRPRRSSYKRIIALNLLMAIGLLGMISGILVFVVTQKLTKYCLRNPITGNFMKVVLL